MLILVTGLICLIVTMIGAYWHYRIVVRNKVESVKLEHLLGLDKPYQATRLPKTERID